MGEVDHDKILEAVREAEEIIDIPEKMEEKDSTMMRKSDGGYIYFNDIRESCEELQEIAEAGWVLNELDEEESNLRNRIQFHLTTFTRSNGIRPEVKATYQRTAEKYS